MSELYLVDKDGHRYAFNADMAQHTNLYAVMKDGVRVRYQGAPSLTPSSGASGMVAGDRAPTEAELLAARDLLARHDHQQGDQIAMSAAAARQAPSRDQDQQGDAARPPPPPTAPQPDPALQPAPAQPQPPESQAADLLSPSHSENQDTSQDRQQAEAQGYQPDDWEGRERQETPVYGKPDPQAAETAEDAPKDQPKDAPKKAAAAPPPPPPPPLPKRSPPPPKK
jgi:hypothetical protein